MCCFCIEEVNPCTDFASCLWLTYANSSTSLGEWSSEDTGADVPSSSLKQELFPSCPPSGKLHCERGIYIPALYNQLLIEVFPFFFFFGIHFISNVARFNLKKYTLELHILSAQSFHTIASLKNADLDKNIRLINPALEIKQKMQKNIDFKVLDVCIFHTDNMLTIVAHNRAVKTRFWK